MGEPDSEAIDLSDWLVSPQAVAARLRDGDDLVLVDVRTRDERDKAAIAGSIHVPMQELDTHIHRLLPHADRAIVVHCKSGKRSMLVTIALRDRGFADVKSMDGGIMRWSREIDPTVPEY